MQKREDAGDITTGVLVQADDGPFGRDYDPKYEVFILWNSLQTLWIILLLKNPYIGRLCLLNARTGLKVVGWSVKKKQRRSGPKLGLVKFT